MKQLGIVIASLAVIGIGATIVKRRTANQSGKWGSETEKRKN